MCLRTGSGWHSSYQRRREPCFQREVQNHISQKGSLTLSFSSHPLHLEEKRTTEMWKLPKFNYFYWKCQKNVKTYPVLKGTQRALWTFAAVCLPFFFFFLFSSLGPPSSKFPFFLSKKQEDRLSLRDFKGVFWILSLQTELLRHPQILLHQDSHNLKLRESVCSHHQLLVLIIHPDTLY